MVVFTVTQLNMLVLPFLKYLTQFLLLLMCLSAVGAAQVSSHCSVSGQRSLPKQMSPMTICLSVTTPFIWRWLQCVSKYTSVLEDIYTSTVAIPKLDKQAASTGGKPQIHQNQNVCPRENTRGLTS